MILSQKARDVRKKSHLARIAAKAKLQKDSEAAESINDKTKRLAAIEAASKAYADFYTAQPLQIAIAEVNAKITEGRQLQRQAREDLQMAQATGEGFEAAEAALRNSGIAIQALQDLKQARFRPLQHAQLTGGDA